MVFVCVSFAVPVSGTGVANQGVFDDMFDSDTPFDLGFKLASTAPVADGPECAFHLAGI